MERIRLHILLLLMVPSTLWCQKNNFELHKGNELFKSGKYEQATGYYDEALNKDPGDYRAQYNLGNSLFRTERYEEAEQHYQQVSAVAPTSTEKAKALHNLGNVYLLQKKLDPAIEAYKNALRKNPRDEATRYNLAYAMKLKDEQNKQNQQQQQQNQDQKNQDKKDQQDQKQDNQNKENQNKDKQDQNDQKQGDQKEDQKEQGKDKKDQNKDKGNQKDDKDKGQQPRPDQISKEQAKRMLDAINKVENGVKKKVDENEAKEKALVNEEKDW